jgi:hypothetical protein
MGFHIYTKMRRAAVVAGTKSLDLHVQLLQLQGRPHLSKCLNMFVNLNVFLLSPMAQLFDYHITNYSLKINFLRVLRSCS